MLNTTLFVGIFFLFFRFLSAQYSVESLLNAKPPVHKLVEFNETEVMNAGNKEVIYISYLAAVYHVSNYMESLINKAIEESKSDSADLESIAGLLKQTPDACTRTDFDGSTISGALTLAIQEINADNFTLPNHEIRYIYDNTCGDEKKSAKLFMNHWAHGARAFFGPEMNCRTEALMAASQNLPILSYKCKDTQVSDKKKYTTFARTVPGDSEITKAFLSLMKKFNWKQFTVVYEDTDSITEMFNGLKRAVDEENSHLAEGEPKYTILNTTVVPQPFSDVTADPILDKIFKETKDQTRIYVTFGNVRMFRRMLMLMGDRGMLAKQEHLLIFLDPDYTWENVYMAMNNHFMRDTSIRIEQSWNGENAVDKKKLDYIKSAFAIIPTPSRITKEKFTEFWRKVHKNLGDFGISKFDNQKAIDTKMKTNRLAYYLYDAVWLYARALHEHISSSDIAERVAHGYDPISDGKAIISRILNRRYTSVQGYDMMIDKNGDANGNYTLVSMQKVARNTKEDIGYYPFDMALDETGMFVSDQNGKLELEFKREVMWDNGVIPKDQPECGFHGELCLKRNNTALWVVLAVIMIVIIGVSATALFAYRSQKFEKDLQSMWKINPSDLHKPEPKEEKDKAISKKYKNSYFVDKDDLTKAAMYKGGEVFVKKLFYNKSKEITRQMKLEMLWMVRLGHTNINKFMGITMLQNEIQVVREKCERGSLMDILNDSQDQSMLQGAESLQFINSFINDIIQGMTYLHSSDLKVHGNLKSTNCLITTRWQIQLADFGLNDLRVGRVWKKKSKDNHGVTVKHSKPKDSHKMKNFMKQFRDITNPNSNKEYKEELCPKKSEQRDEEDALDNLEGTGTERKNSQEVVDPELAHWGNLMWTAPELLVESNFGQTRYQPTQKGDVYAFGVILHEIAEKAGPLRFMEQNETERGARFAENLVRLVANGEVPSITPNASSWMKDTIFCIAKGIDACVNVNPEARPDFRTGIRQKLKEILDAAKSMDIGDLMVMYQARLEEMVKIKTKQLDDEQKRTEELLHRMLPPAIAKQLLNGGSVKPTNYPSVTIYFSDIVGFTKISGESTPLEVVRLLNKLYNIFDTIIQKYKVYKVETIGDAYMVVAGIETQEKDDAVQSEPPKRSCDDAYEIATMAIHIRRAVDKFRIPHRPEQKISLRIGIHTGPCVAGVVGATMPRYCLFGDTVNTASRMESTGLADAIHCSKSTRDELIGFEKLQFAAREPLFIKGKGEMTTYFLQERWDYEITDSEMAVVEEPKTIIFNRDVGVVPGAKTIPNSWGITRTSNTSLCPPKDGPSSASAAFPRKAIKHAERVEFTSQNGGAVTISGSSCSSRDLPSVNEEDSGISNISSDFSRPRYSKSHTSRIEEDNQRKRSSSLPDVEKVAAMYPEHFSSTATTSNLTTSRRNTDSQSMESIVSSENTEQYPPYPDDFAQTVTRKHGMGLTIWPSRKRSLSAGDANAIYIPSNNLNGGPVPTAQSTRLIQKSKRQTREDRRSKDRKSVRSLQPKMLRDASPFRKLRDASPMNIFGSRSSRSNTPENGSLRSLYINEIETPSRNGSVSRMFMKFKFGSSHHEQEYINLDDENDDIREEENEIGTSGSLNHSRSIKTSSTTSVNESSEPLIKIHPELMV